MIEQTPTYHVPVLLNESIEGLALKENGVYVDVTFGGGGHSKEILRLLKGGKLYSFDQDPDAEENFGKSEETENRFTFIASNFRHLRNWMRYYGELDADDENPKVDGILADLGVSSHHLDDESRGFSFRFDSPIDMRMNKRAGKTAADILNEYDEERLAYIIYIYGEVKQARKLASLIVKQRQTSPYKMTGDLVKTCEQCLPRERAKKEMAKVFQALRIEVNHEMDALTEMLQAAIKVLKPGGRLSVITYHSLEDRIVK
ncbi:MAG: 16S rRNA (cytosine(1402)-N(4))-methyltransferase RsmH, partial [Bacteroidaceae bacterium]|nr:16S rRNA (cytosine(1402)-N(4))-methyltransferase RsmH [Bacteroidaceae bacterium]